MNFSKIKMNANFPLLFESNNVTFFCKLMITCIVFGAITTGQRNTRHDNVLIQQGNASTPTFREHGENNNCNSSDGVANCGTIEYLGCTGSKRFYHESAIKMNWFEAWEYCRSMGLHLAAIESRYEQAFIELFLPPLGVASTETYWTSGTDLGKEGQFSWMATGRPLTYEYWRYGEPNNRFGSENCIELVIKPDVVGYLWNDRNCLIPKGYVLCQHDLRYPDKLIEAEQSSHEQNRI